MDLNYDIKTWCVPLETMTVTKITENILETARQKPSSTMNRRIIVARATQNAQKLNLPSSLLTKVKNMIRPIMYEYKVWYKENGRSIRPVLTPLGTVDVERSVRDFLRSNGQSVTASFDMACRYCLEEEIFEFGSRMTNREKYLYVDEYHKVPTNMKYIYDEKYHDFWPIECFWYEVYKGEFVKKITRKELSYEQCYLGFQMSLKKKNLHATKYYYMNNPQATSWPLFNPLVWTFNYELHMPMILPASWRAMILGSGQCERSKCISSELLLKALLKWPYQHLFLEAAQTVMANLGIDEYIEVVQKITEKALQRYEDHNYKELLIGFWKMDMVLKNQLASEGCSSILCSSFLFDIFLLLDKDIALMVFGDMYEKNKEKFYSSFKYKFAKRIYSKEFKMPRLLMDVCKEKDKQMYLKCKCFFEFEVEYDRLFSDSMIKHFSRKLWNKNVGSALLIRLTKLMCRSDNTDDCSKKM